jgi:hypothetical protein
MSEWKRIAVSLLISAVGIAAMFAAHAVFSPDPPAHYTRSPAGFTCHTIIHASSIEQFCDQDSTQ